MGYLQYIAGLVFLVVLCFIKDSDAIRCYSCNSVNDTRCIGDKTNQLDDELMVNCNGKTAEGHEYILCRKIKQVIDFEVNGLKPDNRIIRTCGWDDSSYKNKCYQRSGFGGRQEVCACEKDGCNGSTGVYGSISVLLGLILIKIHL